MTKGFKFPMPKPITVKGVWVLADLTNCDVVLYDDELSHRLEMVSLEPEEAEE